uniref:Uncharacterized protein n=1 Tax=Populus alba TaxID=43335 RepID=A0A4U5QIK1_POPAL|nr:hypothetical protein D5086_0000104270 [Populus alba]
MTRTDGQEKGICSHCHKSGHGEDNCFALTGYPEWWGDRPRGDERREVGRGRGHSNGRGRGRGHRGTHRANAALTNIGSSSATVAEEARRSQCPVGLPDGSSALAVKEGTTVLDGDLCLANVLYVLGLTCNLTSVS